MNNKHKEGQQPRHDEKNSPQRELIEKSRPKQNPKKSPAPLPEKEKEKSHAKKEAIKPNESVTKKVKERLPEKKNLGPSGQQWDI